LRQCFYQAHLAEYLV